MDLHNVLNSIDQTRTPPQKAYESDGYKVNTFFGQASFLPFLLPNILTLSKSLPPSLNHFNHAVNAEAK